MVVFFSKINNKNQMNINSVSTTVIEIKTVLFSQNQERTIWGNSHFLFVLKLSLDSSEIKIKHNSNKSSIVKKKDEMKKDPKKGI